MTEEQITQTRNKVIQDYEELKAGVLMLAEIAGIKIPENFKATDLISELAVVLERFTETKGNTNAE